MRKFYFVAIFLVMLLIAVSGNFTISGKDNNTLPPAEEENNYIEIKDKVKSGETLFDIFKKNGLNLKELFQIRKASASVYRLRNLFPGQQYKIVVDPDNRIAAFLYWLNDEHVLNVTKTDSGFQAEKVPVEYEIKVLHIGGIINDNLISSMKEYKEALMLALKVSDIFAWDIDFNTDLRKGDIYRVIVEGLYLNGEFKKYGDILGVEIVNNGISYKAYRFEYKGKVDYYDEKGKSLRRAFLKAPLSFRRISSTFTNRRYHPILKRYRPHHGLDYAAPRGTPVSAAGDGTVIFAGYKGGYGKLVIIRHPNGYKTYYGHMSRIERKIRKGRRVSQGDIIGYVGATGLATGPHLHYEMRINNRPVNPLLIKMPRGKNIPATQMVEFKRFRDQMDSQLASIMPPVVVSKVY